MRSSQSQPDNDEQDNLRAMFYRAAKHLNPSPTEVDHLWDVFNKLRIFPYSDSVATEITQSCLNFSEQSINRNFIFKDIFCLIKKIRSLFLDYFPKENINGKQLIPFFDELECDLVNHQLKLATLPYRKKLREANHFILHEKRRYYTIFNRMLEPAFIIDNKLCLVETNRAFLQFFKISGKNHIGKICIDVIGQDVLSRNKIENVLDSKTSFSAVEATLKVDNTEKIVIISGTFLGDINNEFSGGIIIIQDITKQKNYEKALFESEEKYRTLIENVPDVTWRADEFGTLYFISQNVQNICGYKPDEMLGAWPKGRFARIHPADLDYVRDEFGLFFASHLPTGSFVRSLLRQYPDMTKAEEIKDGRKIYDVKYRFKHKNGSWIWLHGRASGIYKHNGGWFTDGVFTDITELKKTEDELERHHFKLSELVDERTIELREANENLEAEIEVRIQAEKGLINLAQKLRQSNEELEQFAHVASHDLKEPLMLITAFSQRLVDKSERLDERDREYLKRIVSSVQQMQQLIDGLLELSRVTTSVKPFETVDLTEIVNEVSGALEELLKQNGGKIKFTNLGKLAGDKTQIRQLFQNIIANAIKYRNSETEPLVTISSSIIDSHYCQITIKDNGIGFDPIYAVKIFDPLMRLHGHKEYEGTGIGLATCQKIVARHGGKIKAKSTPGKGATFIVNLPINHPTNS